MALPLALKLSMDNWMRGHPGQFCLVTNGRNELRAQAMELTGKDFAKANKLISDYISNSELRVKTITTKKSANPTKVSENTKNARLSNYIHNKEKVLDNVDVGIVDSYKSFRINNNQTNKDLRLKIKVGLDQLNAKEEKRKNQFVDDKSIKSAKLIEINRKKTTSRANDRRGGQYYSK